MPNPEIHGRIHGRYRGKPQFNQAQRYWYGTPAWSKVATGWRGVSLDTLFAGIPTTAGFAMARSYGGYTTDLPLADLLGG